MVHALDNAGSCHSHIKEMLLLFVCIMLTSWTLLHMFVPPDASSEDQLSPESLRSFSSSPSSLSSDPVRFVVLGDWGVDPIDFQRRPNAMQIMQRKVAHAIRKVAKEADTEGVPVSFVLSVGDQAYESGIDSVRDGQRRFGEGWRAVYGRHLTKLPWFATLGNHDCSGNISAMYSFAAAASNTFTMKPAYTIRRPLSPDDKTTLAIVVVDACTLVCGGSTEASVSSASSSPPRGKPGKQHRASQDKNFRCDGMSHGGSYLRRRLIVHLKTELTKLNCRKGENWCVVAAHWPLFSFCGNGPTKELIDLLAPIMDFHKVAAYFSGHDHGLQHIEFKAGPRRGRGRHPTEFFVSGGGGYELHPELKPEADSELNDPVESKFFASTHGFMTVTATAAQLDVEFFDDDARRIYHTALTRGGFRHHHHHSDHEAAMKTETREGLVLRGNNATPPTSPSSRHSR